MAAEVTSLPLVRQPAAPSPLTADQRYWNSFSSQTLLPAVNSAPITHLSTNSPPLTQSSHASSSHADYIAVTTGPRLQLLSTQTLKTVRTIARTSSPFHSAQVRRDGRIVIAGSDSGTIQAFDTSSRAILRTWNEHKQPVWVTQWHPRDLTCAMSASDDTTVKLWDLPSDTSIWSGFGHSDYVRAGAFIGDGNLIATGSYDQTIKLWDTRIGRGSSPSTADPATGSRGACVMTYSLSSPVEAILPLPGGTTLVGASGPSIVVLDLVAARPLHLLRNHQKTVTSLAIASNGARLLTGALDGHVKAFSTSDWSVVGGKKFPSPILSLSVVGAGPSREDRHVCVGLQNGLLSIRSRLSATAKHAKRARDAEMAALVAGTIDDFDAKKRRVARKAGTAGWAKRLRGRDYTGEGADIVIAAPNASRGSLKASSSSSPWEAALRAGKYPAALDLALGSRDRPVILTCLAALVHRSALRAALDGRTATTVLPVLRFLLRNVGDARYVRLLSDAAMVLLELYGEHLGRGGDLDGLVERLHDEVRAAAETAQMCASTVGMVEMLTAGAGGG
jgi:U3 small nucleolar RNA-associated protein 15